MPVAALTLPLALVLALRRVAAAAFAGVVDGDAAEWKFVPKGTCKTAGGLSADEAKAKIKKG